MNDIVVTIILLTIGVGIIVGIGIVIAIFISRTNPTINSLINYQDCTGQMAEVIVPITLEQPGSIRVKQDGATLKLRAFTRESEEFRVGDRVVIVEVRDGQAWVTTSAELDEYR